MVARQLAVAATLLVGAGASDSVRVLQKEILAELQRIRVAEFVIENAERNHTAQAQLLNKSQQTAEDCKPRLAAAKRSIAESQERFEDLQKQLNSSKIQLAETHKQRERIQHHTEVLEEQARETEERAKAFRSKADAVLPERQAWVQSGISIFLTWLQGLPCQNLVALLFGLLGAASYLDSELFILVASLVLVALGVGVAAGQRFFEGWGEASVLLSALVGGEAALLTAAAAVVGYAGFQLVLGAVIGLLVAQLCAAWAEEWVPGQVPFWYLLFLALGVAALGFGGKRASEVLGFAAGGLLVSSSLVFFLAEIFSNLAYPSSWAASVDAFINGVHIQDLGDLPVLVRIVGLAAWLFFIGAGPILSTQMKTAVFKQAEGESESLREPLLENDV